MQKRDTKSIAHARGGAVNKRKRLFRCRVCRPALYPSLAHPLERIPRLGSGCFIAVAAWQPSAPGPGPDGSSVNRATLWQRDHWSPEKGHCSSPAMKKISARPCSSKCEQKAHSRDTSMNAKLALPAASTRSMYTDEALPRSVGSCCGCCCCSSATTRASSAALLADGLCASADSSDVLSVACGLASRAGSSTACGPGGADRGNDGGSGGNGAGAGESAPQC